MNKFILQFLFVLFFSITLTAQTDKLQPVLVDEFGNITSEDTFARLDGFNYELSKADTSKAIIRIGGGENCFLCHYSEGSYLTAVLKSRILPAEKDSIKNNSLGRYTIEYCNENEALKVRLYLMPPNSTLPACSQTVKIPENSVLFQTVYFYSKTQRITPLENAYVESVSPADGEYSLSALKEVEKILEKSPESKIYIIVYLGTNSENKYYDEKKNYNEKEKRQLDKKSLAVTLIQNTKHEFIRNGINNSQIESIEGGYVDGKRKLEFWLVPKDGKIPNPQPGYFPKIKRK